MIGSKVVTDELMDKRVIVKKIREESMTEADLEKYLNKLPDLSGNVEEIIIEREA